jgi:hypothetical protein
MLASHDSRFMPLTSMNNEHIFIGYIPYSPGLETPEIPPNYALLALRVVWRQRGRYVSPLA